MQIKIDNFRGELPRFAPRLLPDGHATVTSNPRLLSGNVEGWGGWTTITTPTKTNINSIYLLEETYWLSWSQTELGSTASQVDVARSNVATDTGGRIFFTGTDIPRYTNISLATTGTGPYPIASRPLGVPAPIPTMTATASGSSGVTVQSALNTIGIFNPGVDQADVILMHTPGTSAVNVIQDSDLHNMQMYSAGIPGWGVDSPFGGGAGSIDNSGYLFSDTRLLGPYTFDSLEFNFVNRDFTIEMWVKVATPSSGFIQTLAAKRHDSSTNSPFWLYLDTTGHPSMAFASTSGANTVWDFNVSSTVALTANVWHHIAMVRYGSTFTLFVDGNSAVTANSGNSAFVNANNLTLMCAGDTAVAPNIPQNLIGKVAEIRVSECAVYLFNFSLPLSSPGHSNRFTPTTGATFSNQPVGTGAVVSLLHFDGSLPYRSFQDATGMIWEGMGTESLSTSTKKFGNSALAVNLGIRAADCPQLRFGTNDFCIEAFAYLTSGVLAMLFNKGVGPSYDVQCSITPNNGTNAVIFYVSDGVNSVTLTSNHGAIAPTFQWTLNAWHHIACVRQGANFTIYVDGANVGTVNVPAVGSVHADTNSFLWGNHVEPPNNTPVAEFAGYLDECRITNGNAVYTAPFTPPTAPFINPTTTSGTAGGTFQDQVLSLNATAGTTTMTNAYAPAPVGSGQYLTVDFDLDIISFATDGTLLFDTYLANNQFGQTNRVRLYESLGVWYLGLVTAVGWTDQGAVTNSIALSAAPTTGLTHWSITMTQATNGWNVSVTVLQGTTTIGSATFQMAATGNYFAWGLVQPTIGNGSPTVYVMNYVFTSSTQAAAVALNDNFLSIAGGDGWTFFNNSGVIGGGVHGGNQVLIGQLNATGGLPYGSLYLDAENSYTTVWARKYIGVDNSVTITSNFDFFFVGGGTGPNAANSFGLWCGLLTSTWTGGVVQIRQDYNTPNSGNLRASIMSVTGENVLPTETQAQDIPGSPHLAPSTWYNVSLSVTKGPTAATVLITISDYKTKAVVGTVSFSSAEFNGSQGYFVWGLNNVYDNTFYKWNLTFTNLLVAASAPVQTSSSSAVSGSGTASILPEATAYIFTYVNSIGEEGMPSSATPTLLRQDGVSVTLSLPTIDANTTLYDVQFKNIYRAVTANGVTAFYFVAQIPLSQATYTDTVPDSLLGPAILSTLWALPPSDMKGMLALPNGIYAGFSGNQLCLSEQNVPHAWPIKYRIGVDKPIVAIGAVDSMIVIATIGMPYYALGTTPSNYAAGKIDIPQGAVGARSGAYIKGLGYVFATQDGLCAVSGPGRADIITAPMFTKKEWTALAPATMIACAYDDRYFAYCAPAGGNQGFYIEFGQGGAGKVGLSDHATALYSDFDGDWLYAVLDGASAIKQFDSNAAAPLAYTWKSKEYVLQIPTVFRFCQVKAADFTSITAKFYANGTLYYTKAVTTEDPFPLPDVAPVPTVFHMEIDGTSSVKSIQVCEEIEELT